MSESNPKESAGSEKPPVHLVPPALLLETSKVMELGARKYGPYNWRDTEVSLTTYLSAIMRHTMATLDGEDQDPESRRSHMGHVASCCGIILDAMHAGKLIDDRPSPGPASEIIQAMTANERERRAKEAEADMNEHRAFKMNEPDLDHCPNCGGPADNGLEWTGSPPASPYYCKKCVEALVSDPEEFYARKRRADMNIRVPDCSHQKAG